MIVVGFDTATPDTVVALAGAGEPIELRHSPGTGERPGHAQRLLALAAQALRVAGASWDDVERIGVGVGPGTFTGLRIGVATARALAQATGAQLAAVSTLEALATAAADAQPSAHRVLAVLDARRGEAFVAGWERGEQVRRTAAVQPAGLPGLLGPAPRAWLAVGDGAIRFRAHLESAGASVPADGSPLHRVSGLAVCRLAESAQPVDRESLVPDYVRAPDARQLPAARP
jgi:tRNA threonylcarbamoyladenosine biosynthesis protein TsaB